MAEKSETEPTIPSLPPLPEKPPCEECGARPRWDIFILCRECYDRLVQRELESTYVD